MRALKLDWVAGVDGFKSKWCLVLLHLGSGELRARIVPTFSSLLELAERPTVLCVDIPIGLPEFTPIGGRTCEKLARSVLGRKASSVFSAFGRFCLNGCTRIEADRLNREGGGVGVGAQAWGLSTKLREADACMIPEWQQTIYEVHPEVSFWAMQGKIPMLHSKKTAEGAKERVDALVHQGGFASEFVERLPAGMKVGRDDFLDACAALWTAKRIANRESGRFPLETERDARGLDMAIWY
jgi:predicted RNase H-like nuclease